MASLLLTVSMPTLSPLSRRDYLAWHEPNMAEAGELAGPAATVVRSFGIEHRAAVLEKTFAERVGAPFAVSMDSRDGALRTSLKALGLGVGDDVVVPAITSMTTANAVLQVGANPTLADVDPVTHVLTPESIDRARTGHTRAVIVTHLGGRPANLQSIDAYARETGLAVINDAGLGIEMQHGGKNIVQFGTLSIYGSDPVRQGKPEEGGIIITDSAVLADRLMELRRDRRLDATRLHETEGVNCGSRMTAAQAAVGLRFLDRLDPINRRQRVIWNRYDEAFAGLPVLRPAPVCAGDRRGLCHYAVLVANDVVAGGRDGIALALHKARIGTGIHYRGVHLHPRYRDGLGYAPADLPVATRVSNQTLSLPLSASLSDRDVEDVIVALTAILESGPR